MLHVCNDTIKEGLLRNLSEEIFLIYTAGFKMGLQGHAVLCPLMEHIRLKKNDETLQVFE